LGLFDINLKMNFLCKKEEADDIAKWEKLDDVLSSAGLTEDRKH